MDQVVGTHCCVCGARDARTLVEVELAGGGRAILCGSHALMHRKSTVPALSEADLRVQLRDRRSRRDRRYEGDELGAALSAAFSGGRRIGDRRQS
ncbi:MAG: hypothetical protein ABSC94_04580 [Polyangiaceae bacterium]|jgi:hypothetical protein